MELRASMLTQHDRWAAAYHPDGDGFGTVNILMNRLPDATLQLFSVDNAMRDFTDTQMTQLHQLIDDGYQVIYLDLTPSNVPQLQEIIDRTPLYYLDHHQISPGFQGLLDQVHAHNPRIFAPDHANAYAAGLQMYQLFDEQPEDLPYLFISLFGDAKFSHWPQYHQKLTDHQTQLASMADALSSVGLTKPVGPYDPARTDRLFNDVIQRVRRQYASHGIAGFFQAYQESQIAQEYQRLKQRIDQHMQTVKEHIDRQERAISITDDLYILSPILLKEAYKSIDFTGPYIIYQIDPLADVVQYAVMSKHSTYDCAAYIRTSPYVIGGGHTDRAGCTGPIYDLSAALAHFLLGMG